MMIHNSKLLNFYVLISYILLSSSLFFQALLNLLTKNFMVKMLLQHQVHHTCIISKGHGDDGIATTSETSFFADRCRPVCGEMDFK